MTRRAARHSALLLLVALAAACSSDGSTGVTNPPPVNPTDPEAPAVTREMRGMWIATVANIDWPSRTTLTAAQQQAELVDLMTRAAAAHINAIVFQVRPAADAVYQSSLEPWALLLTGTQGKDPGYDPLAFAIGEAHKRGMELHAWINPFRAGNTSDTLSRLAPTHIFKTRRDLIRVYGSNIWMDPGEPDVQDISMRVVTDIVRRYDIDAIHADDYFYPYQVTDAQGRVVDFPDDVTYNKYSGGLPRADWRRANIDRFIERLYREVHAIKPTVKVGISPFGIWRPGFPTGVTGLDAYNTIYADSRKWLQQGWVDYLAPQLYWAIASTGQSFPALLEWWQQQSILGRHVWPGLAAYRVKDCTTGASFDLTEIPAQIKLTRAKPSPGNILYNATCSVKYGNGLIAGTLANDLYKDAALVPAMPWLDAVPPGAPTIAVSGTTLQITPASGEAARWWAMRSRASGTWTTRILSGTDRTATLDASVDRVLVQAVDQAGNASTAAEWRRP